MTADSYAAFAADRVYAACYGWMNEQAERLDRTREEQVDRLMSRRFFRPRSRHQAEQMLGFNIDSWATLDITGWAVWDQVRALSLLANHAILVGTPVHVTAGMVGILSKHLYEEPAACR